TPITVMFATPLYQGVPFPAPLPSCPCLSSLQVACPPTIFEPLQYHRYEPEKPPQLHDPFELPAVPP
ncbi:hypothetical protein Tco_0510045, partial [Tanacetum coccineum]